MDFDLGRNGILFVAFRIQTYRWDGAGPDRAGLGRECGQEDRGGRERERERGRESIASHGLHTGRHIGIVMVFNKLCRTWRLHA